MSRQFFRLLWVATLLAFAGLACNLINTAQNQVNGLKQTANAASTGIQEGKDLVATVAGAATQVGQSGLAKTLEAGATQLDQSGLLQTAQAFATENGPSFLATAQAFATEQGPGLVQTLQAVVTEQGPQAQQTLMALATQAASGQAINGEAPADIPVVSGNINPMVSNPSLLSYTTAMDLASVRDFYEREMVTQGWQKNQQGSTSNNNLSVLYYDKEGRQAIITLTQPAAGQTLVVINIQKK